MSRVIDDVYVMGSGAETPFVLEVRLLGIRTSLAVGLSRPAGLCTLSL